jgi:ABC-type antimicrobial peptide transport system permease subunit
MAQERFLLILLVLFGLVALLLASVGVYGVTAQAARKRTREIGIRMAMGAANREILGLMVRRGMGVVTVGLLAGLGLALLGARLLSSVLHGIHPTDPPTFLSVAGILGGVAFIACLLPALRATTVDPVDSLRSE